MSISHLDLIRTQFPGKMVLEAKDVAVILGCSTKAVEHMRERGEKGLGSMPIKWGSRGRRRVVSILALARWLDGLAEPVAAQAPESGKRKPARQQRADASARAAAGSNQGTAPWQRRPSLGNSIAVLSRFGPQGFWLEVIDASIQALVPAKTGQQLVMSYRGDPKLAELLRHVEDVPASAWEAIAMEWKPSEPIAKALAAIKAAKLESDVARLIDMADHRAAQQPLA